MSEARDDAMQGVIGRLREAHDNFSRLDGVDDDDLVAVLDAVRALEAKAQAPSGEGPPDFIFAWLLEMQTEGRPTYWARNDDEDGVLGWSRDHSKALRLARREDAEALIDDYGWTDVKAVEHGWDTRPASPRPSGPASEGDLWRGLMSCDRIRLIGWTNDGNHMGVEFWRKHPEKHPSANYPQETDRKRFEAFAASLDGGGE